MNELSELLMFSAEHINLYDIIITLWVPIFLNIPLVLAFNARTGSHRYSKEFSIGLPIFSGLASVLTFIIGESLARAFGLVGTISLIRFRTPIKSILDATYLLTSLTIGICCGTGQILIGAFVSFSATIFFLVSAEIVNRKSKKLKIFLNVSFESGKEKPRLISELLDSFCSHIEQENLSINSREAESTFLYNLELKPGYELKPIYKLLDEASEIKSYQLINNETALFI